MNRIFIRDLIKEKEFYSLPSTATVSKAVDVMDSASKGAVMIIENNELQGIFTERDLLRRVVAAKRDPETTLLKDVMTRRPTTLTSDRKLVEAIDIMRRYDHRHVPILDERDGRHVIGMLSIRDLYKQLQIEMEQDIRYFESFIFGHNYGQVA